MKSLWRDAGIRGSSTNWALKHDAWSLSGSEVVGCITYKSMAFRSDLNMKRIERDTLSYKSLYGTVKWWDLNDLIALALLGHQLRIRKGGQCSQESFCECPKASDPTAGLKVFSI